MSAREMSLTGISRMGRATLLGALIGASIVAVPVTAFLVFLSGGDSMSVFAGAHVGFFGGMGYGGMLGAVLQADRFERARADPRWTCR